MSGVVNSVGGFLGTSSGPQIAANTNYQTNNNPLTTMNSMQQGGTTQAGQQDLSNYANGTLSLQDLLNPNRYSLSTGQQFQNPGAMQQGLVNQAATDPLTGSKMATDQVQNNAILGKLFGNGGQMDSTINNLNNEQSQGFQLTPDDQTLYGQTSGNIARMFGAQGNQAASDLANRGLSNSGAAGATFSGLAGNQNEQLAGAQQQIMQQRFQNTQNQIAQNQNYLSQLGNQANTDINSQYQRNLSGVQDQEGNLQSAANLTNTANQVANNAINSGNASNLQAANFNAQNTPMNIGDFATAGAGQLAQALSGGAAASALGGGGTGTTKKTTDTATAGSGAPVDNGVLASGAAKSMFP